MQPSQLAEVARDICRSLHYRYVGYVGEGAFKETHRADSQAGDRYALKVYKPGFSPERTQREIEAMSCCEHPNIAKLHRVALHRDGDKSYLFTLEDFFAGGTLATHVEEKGLLVLARAVDVGSMLIDAVAHIASKGLVHRDLKPDNIMLTEGNDAPIIVDFGLVRNLADTSLTQSWQMRGPGTPYFSSPEQLNNDKDQINWRADQFSLGLTLSVASLGLHPYEEEGAQPVRTVERMAQHAPQTRPFLEAARSDGLPALVKMTAPWPVQRYRKPELLAEAWEKQGG